MKQLQKNLQNDTIPKHIINNYGTTNRNTRNKRFTTS